MTAKKTAAANQRDGKVPKKETGLFIVQFYTKVQF